MSEELVRRWAEGLLGSSLAGRYRLERLLGVGGMGAVFQGRHLAVERPVAIKLLLPDRSTDRAMVERFQREARSAARVGGRGVVEVLDFDVDTEVGAFLVMEFLQGESLGERLAVRGSLPWQEVVALGLEVLGVLARVHAAGIVHRDLKPDNVFLAREDAGRERVVLVDFGIARMASESDRSKLTQTGAVMGTPLYMAPEQARESAGVDHRADLYSVGAILYEALAGRPPFDAGSWAELFLKIFSQPPEPLQQLVPGLPEGLVRAIESALEKDPERRPLSAEAFASKIAGLLPPSARPSWVGTSGSEAGFLPTMSPVRPLASASVGASDLASQEEGAAEPSEASSRALPAVPVTGTGSTMQEGGWAIRWAAFGVAATLLTVAVTVYLLRSLGGQEHRSSSSQAAQARGRTTVSLPEGSGADAGSVWASGAVPGSSEGGSGAAREDDVSPAASSPDGAVPDLRGTRRVSRPSQKGSTSGKQRQRRTPSVPVSLAVGSPAPPVHTGTAPLSPDAPFEGRHTELSATSGDAESSGGLDDALRRTFARAEAARRAGRRREARRIYWTILDRALEYDLPSGSPQGRVVAQAALRYIESAGVGPVPSEAPAVSQWPQLIARYDGEMRRLARAYRVGAARGFPALNQCMLFEMARFHEELSRWMLDLPLPDDAGESTAAFRRLQRERARGALQSAKVSYDLAADSAYGRSPCQASAWTGLQRVRERLRALDASLGGAR